MIDMDNLPVIDWDQAQKLAGNDLELAKSMQAMLRKNLPNDLTAMQASFSASNHEELRKQVHKLHGAVCYCGLPRLKNLLAQLESQLNRKQYADLGAWMQQLTEEIEAVLALE